MKSAARGSRGSECQIRSDPQSSVWRTLSPTRTTRSAGHSRWVRHGSRARRGRSCRRRRCRSTWRTVAPPSWRPSRTRVRGAAGGARGRKPRPRLRGVVGKALSRDDVEAMMRQHPGLPRAEARRTSCGDTAVLQRRARTHRCAWHRAVLDDPAVRGHPDRRAFVELVFRSTSCGSRRRAGRPRRGPGGRSREDGGGRRRGPRWRRRSSLDAPRARYVAAAHRPKRHARQPPTAAQLGAQSVQPREQRRAVAHPRPVVGGGGRRQQ